MDFTLKPFQEQGIRDMDSHTGFMLLWQMGAGKTLPSILYACYKAYGGFGLKTLITCPLSVVDEWVLQFEKFLNYKPVTVIGTSKQKLKILESEPHNIAITNYETLRSAELIGLLSRYNIYIFDEAQKLRNPESGQSKGAYFISRGIDKKSFMLTGTPFDKEEHEMYNLVRIIDEKLVPPTKYGFLNKYFDNHGYKFLKRGNDNLGVYNLSPPEIEAYKRAGFKLVQTEDWRIKPHMKEELNYLICSISSRISKDDVLSLPPKIYESWHVEMSEDQCKAYEQIEEELKLDLSSIKFTYDDIISGQIDDKSITIINNAMTKLIKLNQIASGQFIREDGSIIEFPNNPKMKELKNLWTENGSPKMVIWTEYQHTVTMLERLFGAYAMSISGKNKEENNNAARRIFQNPDSNIKVLICNTAKAHAGITLTASHFVVYFTRGYSGLQRAQSEDRCHRIGQEFPVVYIDLLSKCHGKKTIDHDMLEILQDKSEKSRDFFSQKKLLRKYMKEVKCDS